jgi:hypothetical protein
MLNAILFLAVAAAADERPLVGDVVHGEQLVKEAGLDGAKVDGAWLNQFPDDVAVQKLKSGKDGFPKISGKTVLDYYDALAFLRSRNADLRDFVGEADHVLVSKAALDGNATQRLKERAGLTANEGQELRVFALYKVGDGGLKYVSEKDSKTRDKLKKNTKVGYVVFVPLEGFRKGGYEAAFLVDKDIHVKDVEVRAPDGAAPVDLNQAADRFIGKGARGQYDSLKASGAGKAVGELAKPLSDAFLLGMEGVYMYEVAERDYFAFED